MKLFVVVVYDSRVPRGALSAAKFPVSLGNRLRLDAASEQLVERLRAGCELRDALAPLKDHVPRLEPAHIRGPSCGDDDLLRRGLADLGELRKVPRGGDREGHHVRVPRLLQLLRGRGAYAGELLDRLRFHLLTLFCQWASPVKGIRPG